MFRRVIWIILDSVGIGELPDADKFGDKGADTLGHIFENDKEFDLPNLRKLGLGNIDNINNSIKNVEHPIGVYGKAMEVSKGKDTTVGHWEMVGIHTKEPFPVYPHGFNENIIKKLIKSSNLPGILANEVASGTEVIEKYGREHMESRKPIIYTSADSVFQVACHEDVYSNEELYEICINAREILTGKDNVARVIARPFKGKPGNFERTSARKDFSIMPEDDNLLCKLQDKGIIVTAIGKISDIFCNKGISNSVHTDNNMDGVDKTLDLMKEQKEGLIFTNLVEFDSKWGHRRDVCGYGEGLKAFDDRLEEIMNAMSEDDLLIINSDHGCDPTFKGTDHTREHIPVLLWGKSIKKNVNLYVRNSFADIGATIGENFGVSLQMGDSFLRELTNE